MNKQKRNFKLEVLKFNSGITLIALIITIIVLLILAGVTIALVVGDNGVLNQAVNAADETNRANVQSELEMAVSAVVADWSGARYVNGSNETLEDYMTLSRVEANMNTEDYDLKTFELNVENGTTVGYKGKDYKFTVEITESGNSAKVIYEGNSEGSSGSTGDDTVVQIDGSWDAEKKVNNPELMEGMTAIYWDEEGIEHELTDSSTKEEWNNWYDYTGEAGTNKWANAVTKDSSGNITGYFVWIPRYAYKIEDKLFESSESGQGGTISIKFLQGTTDNDGTGTTIGREFKYSGNSMTDYVVHPAFTDGTSNNFKNGEWDEEVSGFWVAKYEAGYQVNTITNENGTLSTMISNADEEIRYSDLKYTSYDSNYTTNPLGQDLSETGYLSQSLSYPVFIPLTYSYNNIAIGDSYVLSKSIDTASNFYGLDSNITDSHMMKNSEWRSSKLFNTKYIRKK